MVQQLTAENNESLLERAGQIFDDAIDKAGELLMTKPHVSEVILKQLLKCDPEHCAALQLLGLTKHRQGQNAEAVEIIQTVLDIDPSNADNWNNLGLAYGGLENYQKAIECIKKATSLKPEQFLFRNNLALQYRSLGDYDNAIKSMKEALEISERPQLWVNLGGMYGELLNLDEAKKCFDNALKLDPDNAAAHVDLAFLHNLLGDWQTSFKEYEWRFWYYPQMNFYHNAYDSNKLWDGKKSLKDKKVLVYGEQGLGDIIQFARYMKDLKKLGAHVILNCPKTLDSLMRRIEGIDDTTNRDITNNTGEEFPDYDYQFSSMSAINLLKINEINGEPYIKPATNAFKDVMKNEHGNTFNVGIVWAGSAAHPHDKKRSIPLKHFKKLQEVEGVKLFSLQMENPKRQYGVTFRSMETDREKFKNTGLDKFQPDKNIVDFNDGAEDVELMDLTNMIQSFDDTATILTGLDLLICCDTSIAHLAGAMGVPVWIAVTHNPDSRWTLKGNTSHWYDSLRIYRQKERGEWASVFEEIQKDLHETVLQNKR